MDSRSSARLAMNEYKCADMRVGQEADFSIVLTERMLALFLEISGDSNPLHLDGDYARRHGFAGRVAYGLLVSSFYSRLVGLYLPGRYALLHGLEVAFVKPVYEGETLKVSGRVSGINAAFRQIVIKANIQRGEETVSRAKIKAGFYE